MAVHDALEPLTVARACGRSLNEMRLLWVTCLVMALRIANVSGLFRGKAGACVLRDLKETQLASRRRRCASMRELSITRREKEDKQ
jgi:hypothetical protein